MKAVFWIIVGAVAGFVVAHRVNQTEKGRAFLQGVDNSAKDFGNALVSGYRTREAELKAALRD